ncbi:hypothetical protein [Novosphingobium sp.]|uniref:hypothetical protein n=1 Tax=Novosphingobium sp. TaxID=1874826 RepID=UPI002FDFCA81
MGIGARIGVIATGSVLIAVLCVGLHFGIEALRTGRQSNRVKPDLNRYAEEAQLCSETYRFSQFSDNDHCKSAMEAKRKLIGAVPYNNRRMVDQLNFALINMRNAYIGSFREHGCPKACMDIPIGAL